MMTSKTISILASKNRVLDTSPSAEELAMFPAIGKIPLVLTEIATDQLSKNLSGFVDALSNVIGRLPDRCGNYDIDTLEFSLSIDGSGKISLIGELAAGASTSVTMTLRRHGRKVRE